MSLGMAGAIRLPYGHVLKFYWHEPQSISWLDCRSLTSSIQEAATVAKILLRLFR